MYSQIPEKKSLISRLIPFLVVIIVLILIFVPRRNAEITSPEPTHNPSDRNVFSLSRKTHPPISTKDKIIPFIITLRNSNKALYANLMTKKSGEERASFRCRVEDRTRSSTLPFLWYYRNGQLASLSFVDDVGALVARTPSRTIGDPFTLVSIKSLRDDDALSKISFDGSRMTLMNEPNVILGVDKSGDVCVSTKSSFNDMDWEYFSLDL